MKLQKRISTLSEIISIVAIAMSYVFWCNGCDFFYNICVGLFSSGILVWAVALITYFNERNKMILSLYRGCYNFIEHLNSNLRPNNRIAIETVKDNFSRMIQSYKIDIYYYICELSKMRKGSKLYKTIMDIGESTRNIYLLILDDNEKVMQYYLGEITMNEFSNYKFRYLDTESVSWIDKLQKSLDELSDRMNYFGK